MGVNPETIIKNQILLELSRRRCGMYWNHPTGVAMAVRPPHQRIKYGLPGSPDIIGVTPVTVTADMVGQVIGVATGVEVKTATGRQSDQQKAFQAAFAKQGGVYIVARSPEEAVDGLPGDKGGEQ